VVELRLGELLEELVDDEDASMAIDLAPRVWAPRFLPRRRALRIVVGDGEAVGPLEEVGVGSRARRAGVVNGQVAEREQ
jgi:hypothetical protein